MAELQGSLFQVVGMVAWNLLPIAFAGVGALILSNQPRQRDGWLLMLPPLAVILIRSSSSKWQAC